MRMFERERERELQLLNELKEAEVSNVIVRGLNPDVKMKDSGIPWIGMIPEHWEVAVSHKFHMNILSRIRIFITKICYLLVMGE